MTHRCLSTQLGTVLLIAAALVLVPVEYAFGADPRAGLDFPENQGTIPPGTVINHQNWEQYKSFMPVGIQALWSGKYFWKMPPSAEMLVGPTISIPPPSQYKQDTEQYAGKVTLKETPWGGTIPEGYVAGLPFPNPGPPHKGEKILYNYYYSYGPSIQFGANSSVWLIDRLLNMRKQVVNTGTYKLAHSSDPWKLPRSSDVQGLYKTYYVELQEPEDLKYTAQMVTFADDPSKEQQMYVFVPALRRSLRLSSAARCAPVTGTDWINDDGNNDFGGVPADFSVEYLGTKKILLMVHIDFSPQAGATIDNYIPPVYWPKPVAGKWEVRDVDVLDTRRLPTRGGKNYCYGSKIMYVDRETSQILANDVYDVNLDLWKIELAARRPWPIPGTGESALANYGGGVFWAWDVQNDHQSLAIMPTMKFDSDVPEEYHDLSRYASPGGLNQLMK